MKVIAIALLAVGCVPTHRVVHSGRVEVVVVEEPSESSTPRPSNLVRQRVPDGIVIDSAPRVEAKKKKRRASK